MPLAQAQFSLGNRYSEGTGVPKNHAEAAKWYQRAAKQGYAKAQYNLGNMYFNGEGVPVNDVRAYMWWSLSKAQGDKSAATNLDIVKEQMTPAQIAKAQELAAEWWEEHNN